MKTTQTSIVGNRLIEALPAMDRDHLLANCEHVELSFTDVLYRSGERITHVYFPTGSFISLVTPIDKNANLEVGLVGNEGMVGLTIMLGIDIAPFQALVQGGGTALRMAVPVFRSELAHMPVLQQKLNSYLYVLISQIAQTAACTRFHLVEARLARWLLMTSDRAHSDHFHITHAFLAYMLGVRRVGITKAANSLLHKDLISYQRGAINILDHTGLEAASCSCYKVDNQTYTLYVEHYFAQTAEFSAPKHD